MILQDDAKVVNFRLSIGSDRQLFLGHQKTFAALKRMEVKGSSFVPMELWSFAVGLMSLSSFGSILKKNLFRALQKFKFVRGRICIVGQCCRFQIFEFSH